MRHCDPMRCQAEGIFCIIASAVAVGSPPGLTKTKNMLDGLSGRPANEHRATFLGVDLSGYRKLVG